MVKRYIRVDLQTAPVPGIELSLVSPDSGSWGEGEF
jgi:hypothetical protein